MFRILTCLLLCFTSLCVVGQKQDRYLFVTKDSAYQGLKNGLGEVIVPANHPHLGRWTDGELVVDSIIDFYGLPKGQSFPFDAIRPAYTSNTTFDRQGKVLYHPFFFDNGADYIQEGARRFVDLKTGKMGLVHPYGKILITAQYDFISSLSQGYVVAYNGVKRSGESDDEHWTIVPDPKKKYERFVLNRYGDLIMGRKEKSAKNPVSLYEDSLFYPAVYKTTNAEEQSLLERLTKDPAVDELFRLTLNKLSLAILERPSTSFPYYIIGATDDLGFNYILVDSRGKLFRFDYYEPKMPLEKYLEAIR